MCDFFKKKFFDHRIELSNGYWTEEKGLSEGSSFRGTVPLPLGKLQSECPKCKSKNITGILMGKESTEDDPNMACNDCHFVWD